MKTKLTLFAAVLGLLVTTAASAQTVKMKAHVPFSFIVNRATLPAGDYRVDSIDNQGRVLAFRDRNSKTTILVGTNSCIRTKGIEDGKLTFHRYGDRYFLKQIWVAGNDAGHELPPSSREKEVARDFSMQEVVLVANRP
jgi:hypothetical protein